MCNFYHDFSNWWTFSFIVSVVHLSSPVLDPKTFSDQRRQMCQFILEKQGKTGPKLPILPACPQRNGILDFSLSGSFMSATGHLFSNIHSFYMHNHRILGKFDAYIPTMCSSVSDSFPTFIQSPLPAPICSSVTNRLFLQSVVIFCHFCLLRLLPAPF